MPPSVANIIRHVAAQHSVTVEDILGRSRRRKIVDARYAAIHAVRELPWPPPRAGNNLPHPSTPLIGRWFNRDHTTVLNALGAPRP